MFAKHQAWGERDYYHQKILVFEKCKKNIRLSGSYVRPVRGDKCCRTVIASDMVGICNALRPEDMFEIKCAKLVDVARDCGNPMPVGTICGRKCLFCLYTKSFPYNYAFGLVE